MFKALTALLCSVCLCGCASWKWAQKIQQDSYIKKVLTLGAEDLKKSHEITLGMVETTWTSYNLPVSVEGILKLGPQVIPDLEKYSNGREFFKASLADTCITI